MPEDKHNYTQQDSLLLLTIPSLQALAFLSLLRDETSVPTHLHDIRTPLSEPLLSDTLVLFDMVVSNKRQQMSWQNILRKQKNPVKLLLLNMDDQYRSKTIDQWPHLAAIFYQSDILKHVQEGIKQVITSGYYFTQHQSLQLLHHQTISTIPDTVINMLTHRERQILDKLRGGATNNDIAHILFISEHTVRTHIYNIFKKIKVKNRTQAVSLVNDCLEILERPA